MAGFPYHLIGLKISMVSMIWQKFLLLNVLDDYGTLCMKNGRHEEGDS